MREFPYCIKFIKRIKKTTFLNQINIDKKYILIYFIVIIKTRIHGFWMARILFERICALFLFDNKLPSIKNPKDIDVYLWDNTN